MTLMGKSLVGIAALAALAGCSTTAHAGESPASADQRSAPPASAEQKASAGQGGAAKQSWDDVDFEKIVFGELGCPDFEEARGKADIFSVREKDLTGDGNTEAVVAGACVTTTGANPAQVIVFGDRSAPRPLVAIGKGQDLITANVQISGRTVTVVSDAISGTAPRCCPDLMITQAYTWKDNHFTRVSLEQKAQ